MRMKDILQKISVPLLVAVLLWVGTSLTIGNATLARTEERFRYIEIQLSELKEIQKAVIQNTAQIDNLSDKVADLRNGQAKRFVGKGD